MVEYDSQEEKENLKNVKKVIAKFERKMNAK